MSRNLRSRMWWPLLVLLILAALVTLSFSENGAPNIPEYPSAQHKVEGVDATWLPVMRPDANVSVEKAYSYETSDKPEAVLAFYKDAVPKECKGFGTVFRYCWDQMDDGYHWTSFEYYEPGRSGIYIRVKEAHIWLKIGASLTSKGDTDVQVLQYRQE